MGCQVEIGITANLNVMEKSLHWNPETNGEASHLFLSESYNVDIIC